jgi:hypothetical protein
MPNIAFVELVHSCARYWQQQNDVRRIDSAAQALSDDGI